MSGVTTPRLTKKSKAIGTEVSLYLAEVTRARNSCGDRVKKMDVRSFLRFIFAVLMNVLIIICFNVLAVILMIMIMEIIYQLLFNNEM